MRTDGIAVDPHRPDDWRFARAMLESSALATYPDLRDLGRLSLRDRIDESFYGHWDRPDKRVWIARTPDGIPAAILWLEPGHHQVTEVPELIVVLVAVAEPYQRRGLGADLMALARAEADALKIDRLRLFVAAQNEAALALYAKAGYGAQTVEMVWRRGV